MKYLQIFTYQFDLSEVDVLSCIEPYSAEWKELDIEHMLDEDLSRPTLFIIRLRKDCVVDERFWEQLKRTDGRNKLTAVLLILPEMDAEYLYKALCAHVNEVFVESENPKELSAKIVDCTQTIFHLEKNADSHKQLAEYEFNKRQKVMQKIMDSLMEKPDEVAFLLPEINSRYGINLGERNYQVLLISVDQFELCNKNADFMREVSLQLLYHISTAQEIIISYVEPYGHIAVLNYAETNNREQLDKELVELCNGISKLQSDYGNFQFSIGIGGMVKEIKEIRKSLEAASYIQEYRMIEPNTFYYAEDYPGMQKKLDKLISDRNIKELLRYTALGDQNLVREWFERYFKEKDHLLQQFPPAYTRVARTMYEYGMEMKHNPKSVHFPVAKFFALQHIFDGHERMHQTEILLMEMCHLMQSKISSENELALHAIAYMKVHFAEPVNLDVLADNCGFSTSYFSRKFKEQTGENYIDVLTEIRMKEAERLLVETDLSIEEIIEKTGYCDDKHFRKIFMKHTGMNPSEYRKKGKSFLR